MDITLDDEFTDDEVVFLAAYTPMALVQAPQQTPEIEVPQEERVPIRNELERVIGVFSKRTHELERAIVVYFERGHEIERGIADSLKLGHELYRVRDNLLKLEHEAERIKTDLLEPEHKIERFTAHLLKCRHELKHSSDIRNEIRQLSIRLGEKARKGRDKLADLRRARHQANRAWLDVKALLIKTSACSVCRRFNLIGKSNNS